MSRFITTDTNGYRLIAAFDVAQSEVGKEISGIQIRHIDELESFCAEHHPKVAVLCVPRDGAEQVSGRLVDLASRASGTSPTMTSLCRIPMWWWRTSIWRQPDELATACAIRTERTYISNKRTSQSKPEMPPEPSQLA